MQIGLLTDAFEHLTRSQALAWCAGVCGALGLAVSALALRRAAVVPVTALMVGTETVVGAGLGILLAGDRPAPGAGVAWPHR